jgi:hypothetical protein
MPDLQISSLPKLAAADLSGTDLLVAVDRSASEDKQLTVKDMFLKSLTSDIVDNNTVPGAKLVDDSTHGDKLINKTLAAEKLDPATILATGGLALGANSLALVQPLAPLFLNGATGALTHSDSGIVAGRYLATTVNKEGHVTLGGPILPSDLPIANATERGAVIPGNGLSMNGELIQHTNIITPSTVSGIQFDAEGHIKTANPLVPSDLPIATDIAVGALKPGVGLAMNGPAIDLQVARTDVIGGVKAGATMTINNEGTIDQVTAGAVGDWSKVKVDQYGRVVGGLALEANDVPYLDTSKLTTGELTGDRIARNAISGYHLCDYSISWITQTRPKPEFAGQVWVNPIDRSTHIWLGTVDGPETVENGYWMGLGYGSAVDQNVRLGGTYDAKTNTILALNQYGNESGLLLGGPLPMPTMANNGIYLLVAEGGVGVTPAPNVQLGLGDWVLSLGAGENWLHIAVISGAAGIVEDENVLVEPTQFTPPIPDCATQEDANRQFWTYVQPASGVTRGTVMPSAEFLVAADGKLTTGTISEGLY